MLLQIFGVKGDGREWQGTGMGMENLGNGERGRGKVKKRDAGVWCSN
jgi:hypothetical protein